MSQLTADSSLNSADDYRQELGRWVRDGRTLVRAGFALLAQGAFRWYAPVSKPLSSARYPSVRLLERVIGPKREPGVIVHPIVYAVALALTAVFLLAVIGWYTYELRDYTPVTSDDLNTARYTSEILRNPGIFSPDSPVIQRQLPLLQYLTYTSVVAFFGWEFPLVVVPLMSAVGLALLLGYTGYRVCREAWVLPLVALGVMALPVFARDARTLQFYSVVLFLGSLGLISAVAYLRSGRKVMLLGAMVGLAGALYSYNIGVLFAPLPAFYLLVSRNKLTFVRLVKLYAVFGLLALPFTVWHLMVGGVSGFFRQDIRWMVEEGYLLVRNVEFVGYGSTTTAEFLTKLPKMMLKAGGPLIFPLGGLAVIGLIRIRSWTWRLVAILAFAVPLGALIYRSPAPHARYVYILFPILMVLAAYGFSGILVTVRSYRRISFAAPIAAAAAIGILGFMTVREVGGQAVRTEELLDTEVQAELSELAELIDNGKAIIGSRAGTLTPYVRSNRLIGAKAVTEEEYVTYLSWPSEAAVSELFESNNVGWVLLRKPFRKREVNYNVWLKEATGELPVHPQRLKQSKMVERVYKGSKFHLYKVVGVVEDDGETNFLLSQ